MASLENSTGRIYWLTGLSGAGKTTIGRLRYEKLKTEGENVVFLDGDELRQVFGDDLGYTEADRRKSAMRNARLCALLGKQGFTFVTVADLLRRTGVRPVNGTVYSKGGEKRFPLPAYRAPHVVLKKRNTLKITCSVPPGLSLYYTTDGSYPRLSSHQYDGPVIVEQGTVFTVIGVDEWGTRTRRRSFGRQR